MNARVRVGWALVRGGFFSPEWRTEVFRFVRRRGVVRKKELFIGHVLDKDFCILFLKYFRWSVELVKKFQKEICRFEMWDLTTAMDLHNRGSSATGIIAAGGGAEKSSSTGSSPNASAGGGGAGTSLLSASNAIGASSRHLGEGVLQVGNNI